LRIADLGFYWFFPSAGIPQFGCLTDPGIPGLKIGEEKAKIRLTGSSALLSFISSNNPIA
jgi:hypothetical protein